MQYHISLQVGEPSQEHHTSNTVVVAFSSKGASKAHIVGI
jgi:hypothetical protein